MDAFAHQRDTGSNLFRLPPELLLTVVQRLPPGSHAIAAVRSCCKVLRRIVDEAVTDLRLSPTATLELLLLERWERLQRSKCHTNVHAGTTSLCHGRSVHGSPLPVDIITRVASLALADDDGMQCSSTSCSILACISQWRQLLHVHATGRGASPELLLAILYEGQHTGQLDTAHRLAQLIVEGDASRHDLRSLVHFHLANLGLMTPPALAEALCQPPLEQPASGDGGASPHAGERPTPQAPSSAHHLHPPGKPQVLACYLVSADLSHIVQWLLCRGELAGACQLAYLVTDMQQRAQLFLFVALAQLGIGQAHAAADTLLSIPPIFMPPVDPEDGEMTQEELEAVNRARRSAYTYAWRGTRLVLDAMLGAGAGANGDNAAAEDEDDPTVRGLRRMLENMDLERRAHPQYVPADDTVPGAELGQNSELAQLLRTLAAGETDEAERLLTSELRCPKAAEAAWRWLLLRMGVVQGVSVVPEQQLQRLERLVAASCMPLGPAQQARQACRQARVLRGDFEHLRPPAAATVAVGDEDSSGDERDASQTASPPPPPAPAPAAAPAPPPGEQQQQQQQAPQAPVPPQPAPAPPPEHPPGVRFVLEHVLLRRGTLQPLDADIPRQRRTLLYVPSLVPPLSRRMLVQLQSLAGALQRSQDWGHVAEECARCGDEAGAAHALEQYRLTYPQSVRGTAMRASDPDRYAWFLERLWEEAAAEFAVSLCAAGCSEMMELALQTVLRLPSYMQQQPQAVQQQHMRGTAGAAASPPMTAAEREVLVAELAATAPTTPLLALLPRPWQPRADHLGMWLRGAAALGQWALARRCLAALTHVYSPRQLSHELQALLWEVLRIPFDASEFEDRLQQQQPDGLAQLLQLGCYILDALLQASAAWQEYQVDQELAADLGHRACQPQAYDPTQQDPGPSPPRVPCFASAARRFSGGSDLRVSLQGEDSDDVILHEEGAVREGLKRPHRQRSADAVGRVLLNAVDTAPTRFQGFRNPYIFVYSLVHGLYSLGLPSAHVLSYCWPSAGRFMMWALCQVLGSADWGYGRLSHNTLTDALVLLKGMANVPHGGVPEAPSRLLAYVRAFVHNCLTLQRRLDPMELGHHGAAFESVLIDVLHTCGRVWPQFPEGAVQVGQMLLASGKLNAVRLLVHLVRDDEAVSELLVGAAVLAAFSERLAESERFAARSKRGAEVWARVKAKAGSMLEESGADGATRQYATRLLAWVGEHSVTGGA